MLRRAALLVGRRVAPLLDAGAPSGRLAAVKHAVCLVKPAFAGEKASKASSAPCSMFSCIPASRAAACASECQELARPCDGSCEASGGQSPGLAWPSQMFATKAGGGEGQSQAEQAAEAVQADPAGGATHQQQHGAGAGAAADGEGLTVEQLQAQMDQQRTEQEAQMTDMKDQLLRTLADMENLRERSARQIESNKQFAVQRCAKSLLEMYDTLEWAAKAAPESFAKSLLDVADNLERAAEAVPEAALAPGTRMAKADLVKHLQTLLQGVQMTDKQLATALKSHGVEKFRSVGEPFDPNLHQALFEMPDHSKEPGTVAVVSKNGYMLNGRVVRAADVGVVRAPSE